MDNIDELLDDLIDEIEEQESNDIISDTQKNIGGFQDMTSDEIKEFKDSLQISSYRVYDSLI